MAARRKIDRTLHLIPFFLGCLLLTPLAGAQDGWNVVTLDHDGVPQRIALDSQGRVHAVWTYPSPISSANQVKIARRDSGEGWIFSHLESSGTINDANIAIDASDVAHLAYTDRGAQSVKYARGTPDGTGWTVETVDMFGSWFKGGVDSAIDIGPNGVPQIAYFYAPGEDARLAVRDGDDSDPWNFSTAESVNRVGKGANLAVDSSNNPHLVYYDQDNKQTRYATISGGAFNAEPVVGAGPSNPAIVLRDDGIPHVMTVADGGPPRTYLVRAGNNWNPTVLPVTGVQSANNLAFDSSGNLHTFLLDDTGSPLWHLSSSDSWNPHQLPSPEFDGYTPMDLAIGPDDHCYILARDPAGRVVIVTPADLPEPDTLRLYYSFEEGIGSTINDESSNGFDGLAVNGPAHVADAVAGNFSLEFDGVDDRVDVPPAALEGLTERTIQMWIKTTANSGFLFDFDRWGGAHPDDYIRIASDGTVIGHYWSGADILLDGTTVVNDGQWHHVALSLSGTEGGRLFVDGSVDASSPAIVGQIVASANNHFAIGCETSGNAPNYVDFFQGNIDEVKIFEIAMMEININRPPSKPKGRDKHLFFDDFSYASLGEAEAPENGWVSTEGTSGPGETMFLRQNVQFLADEDDPDIRFLRLISMTEGKGLTDETTSSGELHTSRTDFLYGTCAARVRFSDLPHENEDNCIQAFFMYNNFKCLDEFSEVDFEYLAFDMWNVWPWQDGKRRMHMTSWGQIKIGEDCIPLPGLDGIGDQTDYSDGQWHTLVMQLSSSGVRFFIDNSYKGETRLFPPDGEMGILFNNWFDSINLRNATKRRYEMDIDWVYFNKNMNLKPDKIEKEVVKMRRRASGHQQ